jgi:two-component system sensor histidine kinase and response regulator WspE
VSTSREQLLAQFRELVVERLARISRALMSLEAGADLEAGRLALRELHGLKGEARMMGFSEVNALVHEMEDLVRTAEPLGFALAPASVDALLVCADATAVLSGSAPGERPDVARLTLWLQQATGVERSRLGLESAAPSAPAAPVVAEAEAPTPARASDVRADASIRISQQSLEVLTATATSLSQRRRRRELQGARRRQLDAELGALQRLAEELGPAGQALAVRLGRAKDLSSEHHREAVLLATEELRDLSLLSEEVQALRMVPLSVLFEPYPRMVRELSRELGREVELTVEGADEQVDRSVLDTLKDPLMHLVRNAVDHGLEGAAERTQAGKVGRGHLLLRARREGERLVLRVQDDGRGLDPRLLKAAAVRKGLLDEAHAEALSARGAVDLIFLAGFSSRQEATDVSGRGIGLDVVRSRLLGVGGEVTVESVPGLGSTFELRVPVSLTVAPVLFVEAGGEQLCLPASNVVRAFTVAAEQLTQVAGRPSVLVDGLALPFASLAALLGLSTPRQPAPGELVLIIQGRGQQAAVGVDRVLDQRVQAILPLKGVLSRLEHLSGATAQADGSLSLVLAVPHLVATVQGRQLGAVVARTASAPAPARKRRLLVVDDSPLTRELLVSLLESAGYDVLAADDGAQALQLLGRQAVDLVVTDLEMPQVDGLELTRRVKSHGTLRSLPVVIVTTRGSETDRRRGLEAGADGYVTKSDLVRQDLIDVVARLLA